ncbi:hypothetical protein PV10_08863 [Exophiala mesophila]|uniref:Arrestin-like N-terminal domain-containing protein n=1 Tax=Exophiala mesophila TaxID=212818 RepID=A0A0D1WK35_EXOME|nr:uncharacterized protein PV10_08863 [Exophiala mesophila]KIV89285.1 hypothetical protein PV10_08863 [Exophiala mesophila]
MSVKIFVDGFDGRPIPTNSIVKGEIQVKISKTEQRNNVTRVFLNFYGRSKVKITRRQQTNNFRSSHQHRHQSQYTTYVYESKCLLFTHHHILDQSTFQIAASRRGEDGGTLVFPFEFRIPTHSEPQPPPSIDSHNSNCFQPSGCFPGSLGYDPPHKVPPPQPLPDTMNSFSDSQFSNESATASVRYTLRATVPDLSGGARKLFGVLGPAESVVDLPLYNPAGPPQNPIQPQHLAYEDVVRSLRLLPSHQTTKLSFREQMRSVMKKDRLPWLAVGITFQAPEVLWLDLPPDTTLPFAINVRRLAGGIGETTGLPPPTSPLPAPVNDPYEKDEKGRRLEKVPPPENSHPDYVPTPQIFLKRLRVNLVAHTALRGGEDRFNGYGPRHFDSLIAVPMFEFKASRSTPQIEVAVSDSEWLDIGAVLGVTYQHLTSAATESGIGGITGEFLIPNIWRRWGIDWDMRFECADKEIRWQSETPYGGGLGVQFWRGQGVDFAPAPPPVMVPPPLNIGPAVDAGPALDVGPVMDPGPAMASTPFLKPEKTKS